MRLKDELTPQELRALLRLEAQRASEEHGCLVMGVFPTETSEVQVPFAYSIGVPITFPGAADVLIIGLDPDSGQQVIKTVVARMKEGKRFSAGDEAKGLIQRVPFAFRTGAKRHSAAYMGQAIEYHGGSDWPLLQLIWPDPQGTFPWQAGFEERFSAQQPLLFGEEKPHTRPARPPPGELSASCNPWEEGFAQVSHLDLEGSGHTVQ